MPSAIVIKKIDGKPGKVYYPLEKITIPEPKPEQNEVCFIAPEYTRLLTFLHFRP